jgi:hypothetical protein
MATDDYLPVTLYKEDPRKGAARAEYHEVSCTRNSAGVCVLCERHGWWDNVKRWAFSDPGTLQKPFNSEQEARDGMNTRIAELEREGWIHRFVARID